MAKATNTPATTLKVPKIKGKHVEIIGVTKPLTAGKTYKVREKVAQDYVKNKIAKLANPE